MGDAISGVGFWPFWLRAPTARWNFLTQVVIRNYAKIQVF